MSDHPPALLPDRRSNRRVQARAMRIAVAPMLLSWMLGAQLVWVAPAAAQEPDAAAAAAAPESPGVEPGIQYEDALAHENDRIAFEPGGRVTVGFRPRAGDGWEVNGRAPRALPAGTASGRELLGDGRAIVPRSVADDPSPSVDPSSGPDASSAPDGYDVPSTDPSATPDADGASALLPSADDPLALDGTRLRRQVFGFLPYWEVNDAVLDYEVLSTIAYFSVGSDKNGNLLKKNSDGSTTTGWAGWTSSRMTSIINAAHKKGTRVVLTITMFAWTSGQAAAQGALLGSPTARLNLAKQAAAAVRARGADGINLDFEPIASGYADEFTAFVKTVRSELNKQASGYQLTFDTTGYIGNYPIEAATASGAADAVFIMGYDYRTSSSPSAGSIDPLAGPAYDLADTVNAFTSRVAPSKVILGLPWYGRAWSTVSDAVNAKTQSGTKYGASAAVNYSTAVDYAAKYGRHWDSRELSSWIAFRRENCTTTYGCVTSWRQIYYDDPIAMKLRFDLINRKGLRGAGIWALGYDGSRTELRQAIAEKFLNDRTAPLAGIRAMPATQT
ncbi:MAG TPA: glycosyl hydrolase family 18 protein, partial [Candidatus Limnocylindrales bacterium]|nr:glycosyl hydrolase family 18 protein [Candidatus Limnocylindrales bacterium]